MAIYKIITKPIEIEIKRVHANLRRYCHRTPGGHHCINYRLCPEECKMEHKLDLDTAIAWRFASKLHALMRHCIAFDIRGGENECFDKRFIRKYFNQVDESHSFCITVVKLHRNKYDDLLCLLWDCNRVLVDIRDRVDELTQP